MAAISSTEVISDTARINFSSEKLANSALTRLLLFTFPTFRSDQTIEVAGRESTWAAPTPQQRGVPDWEKLNTIIKARKL